MTTHTVKAQTHEGFETFNITSDVETKHELITDAIDTLLTTGGVICAQTDGGDDDDEWTKYLVKIGEDIAIQNNELKWSE